MDTSEHGVLPLCKYFGERATPLPTASHKTDVVASVLPAPSVRQYVTYKQLAQATKLVLNKTMSGYPSAKSHCCTLICLMTNGYLEFLGINVVDVPTGTTSFHSCGWTFAHYTNLSYDGQNKCFHALFHGERVVLHVILIGADTVEPAALSLYDTDGTSSSNDKLDSCYRGVCDLAHHANNGDTHILKVFGLCCRLVFSRMIPSVFLSLTTNGSSNIISQCGIGDLSRSSTLKSSQELKTSNVGHPAIKQYQNSSAPRIQVNSNENCYILIDAMSNIDMNFTLPHTLNVFACGDFVCDKTLGSLVYYEFGSLHAIS